MGFALRLCLLLLISEVCVQANPLIPQDDITDAPNPTEAPSPTEAPKPDVIQNVKPTVLEGEDATSEPDPVENPEAPGAPSGSGGSTTETPGSTTAPGRSSVSTPSFILCVSVLMPVFVANKL